MNRRRFIIGGLIILASLSTLIYTGMRQAVVYFRTPSEIKNQASASTGKFLRVGGMVVPGSLEKDLQSLTYRFQITDGQESLQIFFRGVPPDLFAEGKGAVVEGRMGQGGVFQASTIMAKHAEEYSPPKEGEIHHSSKFVPLREENQP